MGRTKTACGHDGALPVQPETRKRSDPDDESDSDSGSYQGHTKRPRGGNQLLSTLCNGARFASAQPIQPETDGSLTPWNGVCDPSESDNESAPDEELNTEGSDLDVSPVPRRSRREHSSEDEDLPRHPASTMSFDSDEEEYANNDGTHDGHGAHTEHGATSFAGAVWAYNYDPETDTLTMYNIHGSQHQSPVSPEE